MPEPSETSITVEQLATALGPIAEAALASDDPQVLKVATILAALLGCLDGGMTAEDDESLNALSITAGLICEHRIGLHDPPKRPDA